MTIKKTPANCPCCGAPHTSGLSFDDEFRIVRANGRLVTLGPLQFELLRGLYAAWPRPARTSWLAETNRIEPVSVRTVIMKLRRNLAPLDVTIVSPRSVGATRDGDDEGGFYLLQINEKPAPRPARAVAVGIVRA